MVSDLMVSQIHQHALVVIQVGSAAVSADAQFFDHLRIEIFEQLLPGSRPGLVDLLAEFLLQSIERGIDLFWGAATLVDILDAFLEVHARLDSAQYLITCTEDTLEQREFLRQKFKDSLVGGVLLVEEVDHDHVVLLPIAMTAANALLNALGIPW